MRKSAIEEAVSHLAQREHSAQELSRKLQKAGFNELEIEQSLAELQQSGLQSDERYAESFIHSRINRGYGSVRIEMELKERGVASDIIMDSLQHADIDWFALAAEVRHKRFGEENPKDFKNRAKQQRFLQYRGFTHDQIAESFNVTDDEK